MSYNDNNKEEEETAATAMEVLEVTSPQKRHRVLSSSSSPGRGTLYAVDDCDTSVVMEVEVFVAQPAVNHCSNDNNHDHTQQSGVVASAAKKKKVDTTTTKPVTCGSHRCHNGRPSISSDTSSTNSTNTCTNNNHNNLVTGGGDGKVAPTASPSSPPPPLITTSTTTTTTTTILTETANGLALDRINDIMDFEIEQIFLDRSTRREHYECLGYFYNLHPANGIDCGRRFVLIYLAELLVMACGRPPYDKDDDDDRQDKAIGGVGTIMDRFRPLYALDRDQWEELATQLIGARALLLRKDATRDYSTLTDIAAASNGNTTDSKVIGGEEEMEGDPTEEEQDETEHPTDLAKSPVFGSKLDLIVQLIRIQKALAPIRKLLEDQIMSKRGNFATTIGPDQINEIMQYLETVDCDPVQEAVRSLLVAATSTKQRNASPLEEADMTRAATAPCTTTEMISHNNVIQYTFVDDDLLISMLRQPPFHLFHFQHKLESLVHRMKDLVFRCNDDSSILMKLRYTIPSNSPLEAQLIQTTTTCPTRRQLIPHSRTTTNDHSPQHHQTSPATSQVSHPSQKEVTHREGSSTSHLSRMSDPLQPSMHSRSPAVPRLSLQIVEELRRDDREEDDDDEDVDRRPRLPRPLKRARVAPIPRAGHSNDEGGITPDPGIYDEHGKVAKRLRWTEQEKNCVRAGVQKFGIGRWAQIKREYAQMLRNRTSVQIKDCWRTMTKSTEVVFHDAATDDPLPSRYPVVGGGEGAAASVLLATKMTATTMIEGVAAAVAAAPTSPTATPWSPKMILV